MYHDSLNEHLKCDALMAWCAKSHTVKSLTLKIGPSGNQLTFPQKQSYVRIIYSLTILPKTKIVFLVTLKNIDAIRMINIIFKNKA